MSNLVASVPAVKGARSRKPRPKPERRIRLCVAPSAETSGVVRIRVGKDEADYLLTEVPADYGRGFTVEKIGLDADGESYQVNIDSNSTGNKTSCTCKGFCRWDHCKHSDGVAALVHAGKLPIDNN